MAAVAAGDTRLSGRTAYSSTVAGLRRHEQVIERRQRGDLGRDLALAGTRQLGELLAVMRRHLAVEGALDDQDRLPHVAHDAGRIEGQITLEPRRLCGATHLDRNAVPPRARRRRGIDLPLQLDLRLLVGLGGLELIEHAALPLENELAADR